MYLGVGKSCDRSACQKALLLLTALMTPDFPLQESDDRQSRTIDFEFDPDDDTPDEIAGDLSKEFDLSSTDR